MKARALLVAIAVALPQAAGAIDIEGESGGFSLHGGFRSYLLFLLTPEANGVPHDDQALSVSRTRLVAKAWGGEWFQLEVAWDLLPIVGAAGQGLGLAVAPANPLRLEDFDQVLHTGNGWQLLHNLDRLKVSFVFPFFELHVGRQAIGHGSARMFNPSDPFAPFGPASIDTEYKRGVDAVRITVPVGETMEVEVYSVFNGDDLPGSLWLARWHATFPVLDVSIVAGSSYRRPTLAFDLSGEAGGAGWYTEALVRFGVDDFEEETSVRVTMGVDYKFDFGLRTIVEAHYSSVGEIDTDQLPKVLDTVEWQAGELFLLGRWYAGATLSYELTPTLVASLAWFQNLTDASALLWPGLAWDFGPNTSVNVGVLVALGKRPEGLTLAPGVDPIPVPRSEFGTYPHTFFADVRLAF